MPGMHGIRRAIEVSPVSLDLPLPEVAYDRCDEQGCRLDHPRLAPRAPRPSHHYELGASLDRPSPFPACGPASARAPRRPNSSTSGSCFRNRRSRLLHCFYLSCPTLRWLLVASRLSTATRRAIDLPVGVACVCRSELHIDRCEFGRLARPSQRRVAAEFLEFLHRRAT
jgi:hypothetical protein